LSVANLHRAPARIHLIFAAFLLSYCVLCLSGCGFSLAGAKLDEHLSQGVTVSASSRDRSLQSVLQSSINRAGIPSTGGWHVKILSLSKSKPTTVSNQTSFDIENLVRLDAQFEVTNPAGRQLEPRNISVARRLSKNLAQLNEVSTLEEFYEHEMYQEISRKLLNYLALIARTDSEPSRKP
jgi:outer membrane lipopolysaccharide assembly protein LptE/RlpB